MATNKTTPKQKAEPKQDAKAVAKNEDAIFDIALLDPELAAMFDDGPGEDFENLQPDDLSLPRINLQNFTSALVKKPKDEGGCDAGVWANNVDNFLYTTNAKQELVFIPLRHFKSRINFYDMDGAGPSGIKCQSYNFLNGDGNPGGVCRKCPMQEWGAENEPPECDEVHNFVSLIPNQENSQHSLGVISFRVSGFPTGKKLLQLTTSSGKGRIFTRAYRLGVRLEGTAPSTYFVPELRKWEGLNRFDLDIRKAFASQGQEAIVALLTEAKNAAEMVKNLREQGSFQVVDTIEDQQGDFVDAEPSAMDTGEEDMAWDDIEKGQ